jgi:hypothetical protein
VTKVYNVSGVARVLYRTDGSGGVVVKPGEFLEASEVEAEGLTAGGKSRVWSSAGPDTEALEAAAALAETQARAAEDEAKAAEQRAQEAEAEAQAAEAEGTPPKPAA